MACVFFLPDRRAPRRCQYRSLGLDEGVYVGEMLEVNFTERLCLTDAVALSLCEPVRRLSLHRLRSQEDGLPLISWVLRGGMWENYGGLDISNFYVPSTYQCIESLCYS